MTVEEHELSVVMDAFGPFIDKHGLRFNLLEDKTIEPYGCKVRLNGASFNIIIRSGTVSYGSCRVLEAQISLKKSEAMRTYSQDLWTIATEDSIEFAEFQRHLGIPFWKRWKGRFYTNVRQGQHLLLMNSFRDELENRLAGPLQGALDQLFELQKKRILFSVYSKIRPTIEEWGAKNSLAITYEASGTEWNVFGVNPQTQLGVKLSVSREKSSVTFCTVHNGEFKRMKYLYQLTRGRATAEQHNRHCYDVDRKVRWKVTPVAEKLERFIKMLDTHAGDILRGETPFDSVKWLPDPRY